MYVPGLLAACEQGKDGTVLVKKTPDDGKKNCPKHVEFYPKNIFEKLVHVVGFIIIIFFSQCTVT